MSQLESKYSDLALFLLRIGVGVIFIVAGWGKLSGLWEQIFNDVDWGFVNAVSGIGFPFPFFFATLVALIEFFGGIMVLLGYYTRFFTPFLAFIMIIAIFFVKWEAGFSEMRIDITLLLMCCSLFILGSGAYSVDHKLENR